MHLYYTMKSGLHRAGLNKVALNKVAEKGSTTWAFANNLSSGCGRGAAAVQPAQKIGLLRPKIVTKVPRVRYPHRTRITSHQISSPVSAPALSSTFPSRPKLQEYARRCAACYNVHLKRSVTVTNKIHGFVRFAKKLHSNAVLDGFNLEFG